VARGILALTFAEESDYDRATVGDAWTRPTVREELESGADEISVRIEESGEEFTFTHGFASKEREILLSGGLLRYLREQAAA
jgi:aconitate hydratase